MFFKQLQRKPVVTLRQRAVAHHVGEHDGGQFALFDVFGRHERIKPERVRKEMTNLPRSVYLLHLSVDLQLGADACDAKALSEQCTNIPNWEATVERQLARAAPAFPASKRIFTTEMAEVAEINQRWMQRHVASASSVSSVVNPTESDN